MSYRELRNFTEIMRALGYPRLISMENFRRPNFELVADVLYWMVKLYDPETTISDRVEFENERVEFLTGIAALLATKARLKLNTKKLYASDGRAVQELLKLASLLYKANRSGMKSSVEDNIPVPIKVQDVKVARTLASEITQSGAKLFDLLASEMTNRAERTRAMRFLDQMGASSEGSREQAFIERSLRELIDNTRQAVEDLRKESEELDADERNIESKIRKKQEELERTEKRLRSLENVRPQFMDEVEKLEKELQYHYDIYMEKYRNLDYLEHELDKYHKAEEERKIAHDRRIANLRNELYKNEVEMLRGDKRDDDDGPAPQNSQGNAQQFKGGKGPSGPGNGRVPNNSGGNAGNSGRPGPGNQGGGAAGRPGNTTTGRTNGSMNAVLSDDSSDGGDVSDGGDNSDGDDDEEQLSVGDRDSGGRAGAGAGGRGGGGQGGRGGAGAGGAGGRPKTHGSDSDEFVDEDDEEDEDMSGSGDDNDEGSEGSDEQF